MGIGFGPPAIALGEWKVTGVRDSKLALRTPPYLSSLVTYVLASFGMAQDSSQNEWTFRFFQVLVDIAKINKKSANSYSGWLIMTKLRFMEFTKCQPLFWVQVLTYRILTMLWSSFLLHMRKLMCKEVKYLAQGHLATKWQRWDSNQSPWD